MEYHYKHNFLIGCGEVDEYNRMKLSALLNFMQDVATMHSKLIGYGTTRCVELEIGWFLISWHIKIFSYPKGDENIEIKTWSRKIKGAHAFRAFEVYEENGSLVAKADSMWTLVNINTGRPIRPFDDMIEKYGQIDRSVFEQEKIKIDLPETVEDTISLRVQRRDIDTNKHCNNTKYMDFALEVISDEIYSKKNITELEIVYKKPVIYAENIEISYSKVSDNQYINVIKKEDGEIATLIKTTWSDM